MSVLTSVIFRLQSEHFRDTGSWNRVRHVSPGQDRGRVVEAVEFFNG